MSSSIQEPWRSFLGEIDKLCTEPIDLHCFGGFVVTNLYGISRSTNDLDVLSITPRTHLDKLLSIAGRNSSLHRTYGVYLEFVRIMTLPENYEQRLTEIFSSDFRNLKLLALDPYDLCLSKLERNIARDREDVLHLARSNEIDLAILKERYYEEMRPYLGDPGREDKTLNLWIEMIEEARNRQ